MKQTAARPWWRGAVIYQVYPRSFLDTNGDGIGDLPGITARLDHIASLGVDALWVSPFFKSPMKDFGYDVEDYRSVDPMFGTDKDADRLVAEAHARGLKVIIDMVLCHSSDRHPWFQESRASRDNPKADWYVWAPPRRDGCPPTNWQSVFGGPSWTFDARRGQYYLHHFLRSQPNLNWHNSEVVEAMLGEMAHWLDRGVDGLRLDAITTLLHDPRLRDNPAASDHPGTPDINGSRETPYAMQAHLHDRDVVGILPLLSRLRRLADRYPDSFLLGEVADVDTIAASASYSQGADRLHSCYTFQFLQPSIDCGLLRAVLSRTEATLGDGWMTWTFGNHDAARAVSRWGALPDLDGDRPALARLLLALLLSLRGSACLYQGEELGLPQADIAFEDLKDPWGIEFWPTYPGRDGCRTPMPWRADMPHASFSTTRPWLPVGQAHADLAVDRQERDAKSVLQTCRRFLAWRRTRPPLIEGAIELVPAPEPVFAFERRLGDERLLCLFNLSNRPRGFTAAGPWQPVDGHGFASTVEAQGGAAQVGLPPFGVAFLEPA